MASQGKIVLIVLDGVGIGASPDAALYGDGGTNTLGNTARARGGLNLPHLQQLGLGHIAPIEGVQRVGNPAACFGKMREASKGKDSTTGHWELAGIIVNSAFPSYPDGFPPELIGDFCTATGVDGVLGNKAASGTEIIRELGDEHRASGKPIVYTSADSVFQVAAHVGTVPLQRLYEMCSIARERVLTGKHAVGRVIARPFDGQSGAYVRTPDRRDFSLAPPSDTIIDLLKMAGVPTIAVGKIDDLFTGRGFDEKIHTRSNAEGIEAIVSSGRKLSHGFLMANLVDFDMLYGHRQDAAGLAAALEHFDSRLPDIVSMIRPGDMLLLTADHGNDPTDKSTDHSREDVPLLCLLPGGKSGVDLGTRATFADAARTIGEYFGIADGSLDGTSFLGEVRRQG